MGCAPLHVTAMTTYFCTRTSCNRRLCPRIDVAHGDLAGPDLGFEASAMLTTEKCQE